MRIAHVALWTPDLEGAAGFWQRYFDASVGPAYHSRRRPGFISRFVELTGGDQIELMTGPWIASASSDAERTGWDHIAITVGGRLDVDRLAARCGADGCMLSAPRFTGDGFYEAVIAMPDGTRVEITATPDHAVATPTA